MTRHWTPDAVLPQFEATTVEFPAADDGALVATILRRTGAEASRRAFVYVHGFVDYFFHEHVAQAVIDAGFDFYAVELRRYGRSLRGGNRPNYCTNLTQYFDELTQVIDIAVGEDGHDDVVLYGHSTGGLLTALYASAGERRRSIAALVLNSPFFAFAMTTAQRFKKPVAVLVGRFAPWLNDAHAISPHYGESLHASARGEWSYDLRWKPIHGFPAYFGWVRAIELAQRQLRRGLSIACPVLVLHSDASGGGKQWDDSFYTRDIVLDVNDMRRDSLCLGNEVTRTEIRDAVHDVMLSRQPVREQALDVMRDWLHHTASRAHTDSSSTTPA